MKIDKNTTLAQFSAYFGVINENHIKEMYERLKSRPKPLKIAGKKVPENIDLIQWAQFTELSTAEPNDVFAPFRIILNLKEKDLINSKIFDIFGFLIFIKNEIERYAALFEKIKHKPTPEEIQAGIDKLNFGLFGTLDWYARRMGFTDHADAEKTPIVRIYKCLEIDSKTANFQKRLQIIISKKVGKSK